jgi:hypothetical protein
MTAVLVVWANLAQSAPGFFQLQDSATEHILRWILDPRLPRLLLAIVAIFFALVLSRLHQRLVSLETDKRDIRQELQKSFRAEIRRYQAEAISSATIREARIRIGIGDYSGAIRAAVECYDAAQSGNPNAVAHAFDAIGDALEGSERDGKPISPVDLVAARNRLLDYRQLDSDPRAARVKRLIDRHI